jgi:hypothetical protein
MQRGLAITFVSLIAFALLAAAAADAKQFKPNQRVRVLKTLASAETAGAIATATVSCPQATGHDQRPWRAVSGGFHMFGEFPPYAPPGFTPTTPSGSGVVFESLKVGQRSWRVSTQSLWGRIAVKVGVNCQRGVPKTESASSTVATPGTPQVGPEIVARCPSSQAVAGGFSTPPPFTATGAANTVVGSIPSGKKGWQAQVVSSQASSLTSYVYCAKRKSAQVVRSPVGLSYSVATLDGAGAIAGTDPGCHGRFVPDAGGFSEQGLTSSQYLIPTESRQRGGGWFVGAIKVGSGIPVELDTAAFCG